MCRKSSTENGIIRNKNLFGEYTALMIGYATFNIYGLILGNDALPGWLNIIRRKV